MKKIYLTIILVLFVGAVITFLQYACRNNSCGGAVPAPVVSLPANFVDCVARGFPVAPTNPRQCRAGTRVFTEVLPVVPVDTDNVSVFSPLPNTVVKSPLQVTGEARGTWYFEATFPIKILDANNKELAHIPADAKADWMTQGFVPFEAMLTFAQPTTETGTIVLHNDNPSGDPKKDQSVSVPIRFATPPGTSGAGIKGQVLLGPTCPVERPGDPNCKDKPYQTSVKIVALTSKKKYELGINTDAQGNFFTEIIPGIYGVQPRGGSPYPRCDNKIVTVPAYTWTDITLRCDTGIR